MRYVSKRLAASALLVHGGVLAAYAVLAVAITWPLVLRLGSAVASDLGDPVGFTWILWWNAQVLPLTTAWLNAPIFYPSPGAIVFQDSLLGVWPFTTPVQWLGASPLVAYNLLVIGSFALSAWTAYLLCARLMGDRPAAFAGGVVFGFALYRMAQLPHINILLAFWVPVVLLSLHEYLATRRRRWLAAASGCWALQALTSGYFLAYSSVLVGLWAVFFLRTRLRDYARLAVAFGLALAAIWPWLSLYRTVHAAYGFQRTIADVDPYAPDVTALFNAPSLLAIWGRWLSGPAREDQFFPGLTLAFACLVAVYTSRYWARPLISAGSRVWLAVGAVFAAASLVSAIAPTSFQILGIGISLGRPYKPLSWVWISLALAFFCSSPVRRLLRDRSVAGFYALAAVAFWIVALGPTVRFMGERIWYKAPYSWLMVLPGWDAVRVPARFWMLVLLGLAVVVSHALAKLRRRAPRAAPAVTALVCLGLLAEAWPARLAPPDPPERFAALEARAAAAPVLELPLGSPARDLAAMYRSMYHRAPVVNGYSAYAPASFIALGIGLEMGDAGALAPFSERTPLDIVVHTGAAGAAAQVAVVEAAGARLLAATDRFRLYHLPRRPPTTEPAQEPAADIDRVTDEGGSDVTRRMTDDNPFSLVFTKSLDVTLVRRCRVNEIQLEAVPWLAGATVSGGPTGGRWQQLWSGSVAELTVRGALAHPRAPRLRLRFVPVEVDHVTIDVRVPAGDDWLSAVLDVRVFGPDCGVARPSAPGRR